MIKEIIDRIRIFGGNRMPNRMTQGFGADLGQTQEEEARAKLEIAKKSEALSERVMRSSKTGKYV